MTSVWPPFLPLLYNLRCWWTSTYTYYYRLGSSYRSPLSLASRIEAQCNASTPTQTHSASGSSITQGPQDLIVSSIVINKWGDAYAGLMSTKFFYNAGYNFKHKPATVFNGAAILVCSIIDAVLEELVQEVPMSRMYLSSTIKACSDTGCVSMLGCTVL